MSNIITTNVNTNVVQVTSPGPLGPRGPQGVPGERGTVEANSGFLATPYLSVSGSMSVTGSTAFSGSVVITGSLTVSGSNTFINIGPARFTGSVGISGSLSASTFSGSGAGLTDIPASAISGLNLSRIAIGNISASVSAGGTSFTLNNGASNLFTVNSSGLGTFLNGLTVNGSAGTFNQGLNVNNVAANLNAGVLIQGTATLNGSAILTAASLSTNRITDSNISASVSSTGKAFNVTNNATSLMSVDQNGVISGSALNVKSSTYNTVIDTPNIALVGNATLNGQAITTAGDLTLNQIKSGAVTASVSTGQNSFTVQNGASTLMNVSSSGYVSASGFIGDGSRLSNVGITYLSGSNPLINSIQVADFDNNVAVTYINGNLKFIFGTPTPPSTPSVTLSGFATDRFNKQSDSYNTLASWDVGGYTLVSAKLYYTVTGQLLDSTTTGTSFNVVQTTTGSGQSYRVEVTSSSPLDSSVSIVTATTTGTLSKSRPNVPTISISSNTVQLGISSDQIEEGATGDINFSAAYGSANAWEEVSLTTTPGSSPQSVSSATGAVTISATSNYQSPAGTNDPQIFDSRTTTNTYSRIRSVRYGASSATSFSEVELQDLEAWDTGLGGAIGVIAKGTVNPNNYQFTVTTSGNYIYIVVSNVYTLTGILNVNNSNANDISVFTATTVGGYKVYRSNNISATTILYKLTT
jgi:hypothetical protein